MKERVFYVINLDKQRIGVLSLFLFALFFSFFFLGVSVGKGKSETQNPSQVRENVIPEVSKVEEKNSPLEETIPLPKPSALEVPMADLQTANNMSSTQASITNPNFAESSTAKDEEEERKAQIVDLTKPINLPKKSETKHKEVALKNQSPLREKREAKKEFISNEKLYTIQLGAFGTRESAESFVNRTNQEKPKSRAFIVYKNGFFVVQMGKSPNKESLQKMIGKLKSDTKSKAMIVSFIPLNR
jgi:cell division septation protein DedD